MYDIPETAIQAFEAIHGLRVTVHDVRGDLWAHLAPGRFQHTHPLCQAVKAHDDGKRCFFHEVTELRKTLPQLPAGRYHTCFAGLVEWVLPVFHGAELAWVLFAGLRMPGTSLKNAARLGLPETERLMWPHSAVLPRLVEADEAQRILEHLRQLAARLTQWASDIDAPLHSTPGWSAFPEADNAARRPLQIRRFIAMHHREQVGLAALAGEMGLSESRTSHVVRELCGTTFQDLVTDARMKTALGLLRTSDLPVSQVAQYCGFNDTAHFYRLFRRKYGLSPAKHRAMRTT